MASFLTVMATENENNIGQSLFHYGLGLAFFGKYQPSESIIESEWAYAASFVRKNGSQTKIARNLATGSWLLASGTWFHENDLGSGKESALLSRFLTTDVEKLSAKLEGFFTIIIGDALEREIFLITDITGSHRACGMIPIVGRSRRRRRDNRDHPARPLGRRRRPNIVI